MGRNTSNNILFWDMKLKMYGIQKIKNLKIKTIKHSKEKNIFTKHLAL